MRAEPGSPETTRHTHQIRRAWLRRLPAGLPAIAVCACPIGKLLILAGASSSVGVTLDNPWITGLGLAWITGLTAWWISGRIRARRRQLEATQQNPDR